MLKGRILLLAILLVAAMLKLKAIRDTTSVELVKNDGVAKTTAAFAGNK